MGSYARIEHYLTTLEVETLRRVLAALTGLTVRRPPFAVFAQTNTFLYTSGACGVPRARGVGPRAAARPGGGGRNEDAGIYFAGADYFTPISPFFFRLLCFLDFNFCFLRAGRHTAGQKS